MDCEFCSLVSSDETVYERKPIYKSNCSPYQTIGIDADNDLYVLFEINGFFSSCFAEIKYCPMCGRELGKVDR